jgi:hypothetical protein
MAVMSTFIDLLFLLLALIATVSCTLLLADLWLASRGE